MLNFYIILGVIVIILLLLVIIILIVKNQKENVVYLDKTDNKISKKDLKEIKLNKEEKSAISEFLGVNTDTLTEKDIQKILKKVVTLNKETIKKNKKINKRLEDKGDKR